MAEKDVPESVAKKPIIVPVSCWGNSPFGTIMYRYTFRQTVARSSSSMLRPWLSAQCSESE